MEGVGARLGRSSSRYGPTTVFTGPVRKWRKKWVHVTPSNSNNNSSNHHHRQSASNSTANGSRLLLYRWAPITPSSITGNGNGKIEGDNNEESKISKDDGVAADEAPKRKFKYIPVALLEEQMNEASRQSEDEAKPMETDQDGVEKTSNNDSIEEKPDINDVPADENQASENSPLHGQDLNESTLDLSLGLKAHEGENDSETKTD